MQKHWLLKYSQSINLFQSESGDSRHTGRHRLDTSASGTFYTWPGSESASVILYTF
ncbi:hypothetical protein [Pontibacter mucosus]|uniref:hypothetical protein n=1 Tax=Pontibacter mucosus TaxID=1649266 RepID=UPI001473AE26|nr:hypothetical protein [Pontibacter mucosus]